MKNYKTLFLHGLSTQLKKKKTVYAKPALAQFLEMGVQRLHIMGDRRILIGGQGLRTVPGDGLPTYLHCGRLGVIDWQTVARLEISLHETFLLYLSHCQGEVA